MLLRNQVSVPPWMAVVPHSSEFLLPQKLVHKSVQGRTLLCCLNPLSQVKILEIRPEAVEAIKEVQEGLNPLSQVKTIRVAFLFFR